MRNKKLKKNDFGGFQLQEEVREKNIKNCQMIFRCIAKHIKKIIKYLYLFFFGSILTRFD